MRTTIDLDSLRRLHAVGKTDRQIAKELNAGYQAVRCARRRVGLTPNDGRACPEYRAHAAAKAAHGGAAFAAARAANAARRVALAESYGLPATVRPLQVKILVLLASGPMTTKRLADACERRGDRTTHLKRFNNCNASGRNYLIELRKLGLVASVNPGGRGLAVYFLTPLAIDLLSRGKSDDTGRTDSGRGTAGERASTPVHDSGGC